MSRNHNKIAKGLSLTPVASRPADPENGDLIYNSSNFQFEKYEDGIWKILGTTSLNLVTNGDAESAVTSIFTPYADAAASRPVDGTGGVPNVTTSVTSTNPLTGNKSFLLTKDAVNRQGQGWSVPFTVPLSMRAKVLQIEIDYIVNSGTFVAGSTAADSDVIWYLYDITNSALIEPSSIKLLSNSSTLSDKFKSTFQTSATGSSYRLIAHCATTSVSAYELKVEVVVSPSAYVYGTPFSDWQQYTPTFAGLGTPTSVDVRWRRAAQSVEIEGRFTSGTVTGAAATISLPSGLVGLPTSAYICGDYGTQGTTTGSAMVYDPTNNNLYFGMANWGVPATGTQVATGGFNSFNASIPVKGWSSSVQMSDQTDTRVVAASYYGHNSANFADNTYTTIQFNTKLEDTHSMFSAGTTTIKVAGLYEINAAAAFVIGGYAANNIFNLRVRVNGATDYLLDRLIYNSSVQPNILKGSIRLPLKTGDTIVIQAMKTNFGANSGFDTDLTQTRMSIVRVSGPSAIAASETIAASYYVSPTIFTTSTTIPINFDTKEIDTHGAVTTGATTWKFTAPSSGLYEVGGSIFTTAAGLTTRVYKNGSYFKPFGTASAANNNHSNTVLIRLNAGEYIDMRCNTGGSNISGGAQANDTTSTITIKRVGN